MSKHKVISQLKYYSRWILISTIVGALCGTASAVFLAVLEETTKIREAHSWLLFLLPIGGLAVGLLYHSLGRSVPTQITSPL